MMSLSYLNPVKQLVLFQPYASDVQIEILRKELGAARLSSRVYWIQEVGISFVASDKNRRRFYECIHKAGITRIDT